MADFGFAVQSAEPFSIPVPGADPNFLAPEVLRDNQLTKVTHS